jgi:hypothetical protein
MWRWRCWQIAGRLTGIGVFEGRDGTRLDRAKPCLPAEVGENPVDVVHDANLSA